ncbi:MAG: type II secretion system GspH family protein [Candidatus Doudnabacteria bacterium]|nr:type II secretion system GspH family protein [Candidatus Doudnabacteria bacterium]
MMRKTNSQSGQTLLETIIAIFILTTVLTAGLSLTIYSLSHSDRTGEEIIATNLAREAIDVVRNMRDTNWLESDGRATYDLATDCAIGANTFSCFPKAWEGVPLSAGSSHYYPLTAGTYRLEFDPVTNSWNLAVSPVSYAMYRDTDGYYSYSALGAVGVPIYSRKIVITHIYGNPFSASDNPTNLSELRVTAVVGWTGRGCQAMTGTPPDPSTTNCSVAASENLTNWKDYR